jgi:large subunit ribosomal protein L19e
MNLSNKKALASKVLKVGKGRIVFTEENLNEIKEAITRQDILELYNSKAIQIREIRGRKTRIKRKHRRGKGKIKKTINTRKRDYVNLTRKLRVFAKHLSKTEKIDGEKFRRIRKMIKAKKFKSKRHLNETLEEI